MSYVMYGLAGDEKKEEAKRKALEDAKAAAVAAVQLKLENARRRAAGLPAIDPNLPADSGSGGSMGTGAKIALGLAAAIGAGIVASSALKKKAA